MPVSFEEPPPAPFAGGWIGGIHPSGQFLLERLVAGCEKHLACRPGELVIVHGVIAVMGDLLVRAVLAMPGKGAIEKGPAFLRLLQVVGGSFRKLLLELW